MIAGRYRPLEAARPGVPCRARDQQTAQTVMLREVTVAADARSRAAVARAQASKGVLHPALIALFDVTDVAPDRLLLAYEFVPAQSIKHLSGGQPFHPRRAAEVMSEIADGIADLHARGLVHGAISTETVLVTTKGKAKLDRLADPSLITPEPLNEDVDLKGVITVLRELTAGAKGTLPILDQILEYDDGAALGSAAMLAAALRAAAARPADRA
jgi:serine/threonine protein kinase